MSFGTPLCWGLPTNILCLAMPCIDSVELSELRLTELKTVIGPELLDLSLGLVLYKSLELLECGKHLIFLS